MESYDLFLSIGPYCRPAYHLLYNNLRRFASPLDWQKFYSLDTVIQLFKTSFSSFFSNILEDESYSGGKYRRVIDKTNNITSIHHFDKNIPLEECQQEFVSKMRHRYVILHNKLETSSTLMLVCCRNDDVKKLEKFLSDFSELYKNLYITLMNIRDDFSLKNTDIYTKKHNLNSKLTIIEHVFNDTIDYNTGKRYDLSWGNEALWNSVLRDYRLTGFKNTFKELYERLKGKNIVIYGAGVACSKLINELSKYNINANGIAVTCAEDNPSEYEGLPVSTIEKYSYDDVILIALRDQRSSFSIKNSLLSKGYNKVVEFEFTHGVFPNVEDIHKI